MSVLGSICSSSSESLNQLENTNSISGSGGGGGGSGAGGLYNASHQDIPDEVKLAIQIFLCKYLKSNDTEGTTHAAADAA